MSGVEVAGLVLGAFPLIVSAMEHYENVKKPTTIWWRIRRAHSKDYNRVKECEILFQDQLELLLYPLLDDEILDTQRYESLLADPGGEGWRESDVDEALTERLQHRYIPYTKILSELREPMEKLCKASKVDDPQFQELLSGMQNNIHPGTSGKNARNVLMTRANLSFQGKRLKYSFTSLRRAELLEEVEGCIRRLKALLKASSEFSDLARSHKTFSKRPVNKKLLCFWKHAGIIFKLLQIAWSCSCRGKAHLWLQHHPSSIDSMAMQLPLCHGRKSIQIKVRPPTLQLNRRPLAALDANHGFMSAPVNTRTFAPTHHSLPVRTISSTSKGIPRTSPIGASVQIAHTAMTAMLLPSNPQARGGPGTDICKSFGSSCAANDFVCPLEEGNDKYCVYSRNEDFSLRFTVSLAEGLASRELTRVQRYEIALALASSHLQLHSSPWLHHAWDIRNIFLPIITEPASSRIVSAQPHVLSDLDKAAPAWPKNNASFTSLGIVLLELCFDKPFTEHKLWRSYPGKEDDPLLQQAIAQKWAEQVAEEAGEDYELAVKWVLKEAPVDSSSESWRADFAEMVVQPLQRCCETLKPRR